MALFFAIGPVEAVKQASEELRKVTDCATAWYPDVIMPDTGLIDIYASGVSKAHAVSELALRAADQLYKSLAVACGDRKYFSSTFGSKMSISDKVDAFPVLRNAVEA